MAERPADAWPAGDRVEWHDDETRTFHDFFNGTTRPYTDAENAEADERAARALADENARTLRQQARDALARDRAFLALASPTNAQTLAHVKDLTRQVIALARLELDDLTGTD